MLDSPCGVGNSQECNSHRHASLLNDVSQHGICHFVSEFKQSIQRTSLLQFYRCLVCVRVYKTHCPHSCLVFTSEVFIPGWQKQAVTTHSRLIHCVCSEQCPCLINTFYIHSARKHLFQLSNVLNNGRDCQMAILSHWQLAANTNEKTYFTALNKLLAHSSKGTSECNKQTVLTCNVKIFVELNGRGEKA